jgi:alkylation response protein AidB-like acyl-CoA dehydrogenase
MRRRTGEKPSPGRIVLFMTASSMLRELRTRFAPIIETIAANSLQHEADRSHLFDEVRALKEAGFGALRLDVADGGSGASLEQLFALLIDLAAADSNIPQIWRIHIAFVEDQLGHETGARWRRELASNQFFGGAWAETGGATFVDLGTTLTRGDDGLVLNGTKYYSTGSLYSDWISILVPLNGPTDLVTALVRTDAPGVRLDDDWFGIGQRLTGSGTTVLTDVAVNDDDYYPFTEHVPYGEALVQLVHLATLAGIARAAHTDVVAALRARTRVYPAGLSSVPRNDPQYQEIVGRIGAVASATEASVLWCARQLDEVVEALDAGDADAAERVAAVTVAVFEAQVTVTEQTLEAATLIYDVLGSSALERTTLLDRHWRNARTLTSHNPRAYKARIAGGWHLNGTDPVLALLGAIAQH